MALSEGKHSVKGAVVQTEGKVGFRTKGGAGVGGRSRRGSVASASTARSRRSVRSTSSRRSSMKSKKGSVSKARSEGIVSMDPATSDYVGPRHGSVEHGGSHIVGDYVEMMVNPWCGKLMRLPDTCITPTSLYKVYANRTHVVSGCATYGDQMIFAVNSRMTNYSTSYAVENDSVYVEGGSLARIEPYRYQPGNILTPLQRSTTSGLWRTPFATTPAGIWADDFGQEQAELSTWVAAYRPLAMALRVRVVGLPTGQFMAPGKIYFAQIRCERNDVPVTEQDFVVLETKGRASHVSLDAVREAGSKTYFVTPDGSDKFEMTSSFLPAPGVFKKSDEAYGHGTRMFPGLAIASSGQWADTGLAGQLCPYGTTQLLGDAADQKNADQTYVLIAACFGLSDGVILEVDYALCGEYIPDKNAPPGVETMVQVPSHSAMDAIFATAAVTADLKPLLLQAPGDKTQMSTSSGPFAPAEGRGESGKRVRGAISSAVSRVSGRSFRPRRGRAEGFWDFDWLSSGSFGKKGGGLSWDFAGK